VGQVDQDNANALVERALTAGVNFIDTADVYSGRPSRSRSSVRRYAISRCPAKTSSSQTKVRGPNAPGPNTVGLSRNHIMNGVEASLKRLGLDYIDLYQVHGADLVTPIEETIARSTTCVARPGSLHRRSNMAAWQIMKANGIARQRNYARFETVQSYYTIAGPGSGARNHSRCSRIKSSA